MRINNRRALVTIAMIIYVAILLLFNLGNAVMPVFLKNTPYGTSIFGYLMACMYLGQFLFSPFWGTLSDKRGRAILAISPFGYGIGQMLYVFSANSLLLLIASRVIAGIFAILFLAQFVAYVSDIAPEQDRQRILSMTAVMSPLGAGLAYLIGGFIKSPTFATVLIRAKEMLRFLGDDLSTRLTQVYTFPFFMQLLFGCFASIFLYFFITRNNQYQVLNRQKMPIETNPIKRIFAQFNLFLEYRHTIVFSVVTISFFNSIAYAATQSIQYYLQDALGLDASGIGIVVFDYNILSVILSLLFQGIMLHKYTRWQNLLIANATVIILALLLSFAGIWQLVFIMSMIVVMNTLLVSIIQGTLADYSQKDRGVLLGLNQAAISLASIVGNFILSPLYGLDPTVFHYRLPFAMMAVFLSLVTLIILGPLKKQMKQKR